MISVIIPTHKRADLLFYELEHIYMQKDVEFEIIVVNDIEEEDETDIIREKFPNVIYIKDSKIQGPSEKHKAGLRIAKGQYLYMPDDDDYLLDEYFFKKAIAYMEMYPKVAFVSGQCNLSYEFTNREDNYIQSSTTNIMGYVNGAEYLQHFQHKYEKPWSTVSTLFRRRSFDETNAMNMYEMSDSSMYMQSLLWGDAYIMDDVVAVYRIKDNSLTTTLSYKFMRNVLKQKEYLYKKSLGKVNDPKYFWLLQYVISYNFCPNKTRLKALKLLTWGVIHSHGTISLLKFIIFAIVRDVLKLKS